MANYTIELKDVIACGHNIFDFNYPFYDEKKRPEFEEKFIRHFYFREICCPTVDRFKVYLRDKMDTVFPYYNKLFEAAKVEYDLLNNYNLTEEFVTTRENEGKTHGQSYTVGQHFGEQSVQTENNRITDGEGNIKSTGKEADTDTAHSETNSSNHSKTDTTNESETNDTTHGTSTNNEEVTGESTEGVSSNNKNVRKFLDTPQGLTSLTDSKYLTDLTETTDVGEQDKAGTSETNKTANGETDTTSSSSTSGTGESETTETGQNVTDSTRSGERNTETNQDSTNKETTHETGSGTTTDEQKSTQDNNTKTFIEGKQTEKHTLTRIGNIGVQTGADMMRIHVNLQKTLQSIERMFFDECEDLFMMVY